MSSMKKLGVLECLNTHVAEPLLRRFNLDESARVMVRKGKLISEQEEGRFLFLRKNSADSGEELENDLEGF